MHGARRPSGLPVWQLADRLRTEVRRITRQASMDADPRLRARMEDGAAAVSRNVSDALGAARAPEAARFVRLARGAVAVLHDDLRVAVTKQCARETELKDARETIDRLYAALSSMLADATRASGRFDGRRPA